jgi:hypothetical protein
LLCSSPGVLLGSGVSLGLGVRVARTVAVGCSVAGGNPLVGVDEGIGVFDGLDTIRVGVAEGGTGVSDGSNVGGGVGVRLGFTGCVVGEGETVGDGATGEAGAVGVLPPGEAGGTAGNGVAEGVTVGCVAVAVRVRVAVRRGVGLGVGVGDDERVRMLSTTSVSVGSATERIALEVGPTIGVSTANTVAGGCAVTEGTMVHVGVSVEAI